MQRIELGDRLVFACRYEDAGINVEVAVVNGTYEVQQCRTCCVNSLDAICSAPLNESRYHQVDITADPPRAMVLHWAVDDWKLAPQSARPHGTIQVCRSRSSPLTLGSDCLHSKDQLSHSACSTRQW
jgi:hypothetical protein